MTRRPDGDKAPVPSSRPALYRAHPAIETWNSGDPSWWARLGYDTVRAVLSGAMRVYWRLEIHGREHVPPTGPFILAPVHRSYIDTPLVCAVTRRRLRYMGKEDAWKYRFGAWFLSAMGGFPVNRGMADREALHQCERVLDLGQPLVMFPEGTRRSGPVVEEVFDGPAFVSARTGAPIVPVGIGGSDRAMPAGARMIHPVPVSIVIGAPIVPPPRAEGRRVARRIVRELSERLRADIQDLYDEAQELAHNR